jgi:TonB family protein
VRLGPDGRVEGTAIARSSGTALLDSLALSVARAMVFTPAVDYAGRYSSVETTVPIRFRNAMN